MAEVRESVTQSNTFIERHPALKNIPKGSYPKSVLLSLNGRESGVPLTVYGEQIKSAIDTALELADSPVNEVILSINPSDEVGLAFAAHYMEGAMSKRRQELNGRGVSFKWFGKDIMGAKGITKAEFQSEHNSGMKINLFLGEVDLPVVPNMILKPVNTEIKDPLTNNAYPVQMFTTKSIDGAILNYASGSQSTSSV